MRELFLQYFIANKFKVVFFICKNFWIFAFTVCNYIYKKKHKKDVIMQIYFSDKFRLYFLFLLIQLLVIKNTDYTVYTNTVLYMNLHNKWLWLDIFLKVSFNLMKWITVKCFSKNYAKSKIVYVKYWIVSNKWYIPRKQCRVFWQY